MRGYIIHILPSAFCILSLCFVPPARAELDYEFAKALLERDQTGFTTTDLVERLAQQLEQNPATQTEARLIKAALKRRLAATAGAELCVQYLDEASALYKEILAGPRSFRLYAVAEQDSAAMTREVLYAKLALAKKDKPQDAAGPGEPDRDDDGEFDDGDEFEGEDDLEDDLEDDDGTDPDDYEDDDDGPDEDDDDEDDEDDDEDDEDDGLDELGLGEPS